MSTVVDEANVVALEEAEEVGAGLIEGKSLGCESTSAGGVMGWSRAAARVKRDWLLAWLRLVDWLIAWVRLIG